MKTFPLLPIISFCCSWASLVIELPHDNDYTVLTLDTDIEIRNVLSFCIRFNLNGKLQSEKALVCSHNGRWCFVLRLALNHGFVILNGQDLIFKVPNASSAHPHAWHHFCFSSDENTYQVPSNYNFCKCP